MFVAPARTRQVTPVREIEDPLTAFAEPRASIDGRHEAQVEGDHHGKAEEDDFGIHNMEMELDAIDIAMMERLGIDIYKLDQLDLVEDVQHSTPAMDKLPSPITITEMFDAQRTYDFCQTIRNKMSSENSFIEGGWCAPAHPSFGASTTQNSPA